MCDETLETKYNLKIACDVTLQKKDNLSFKDLVSLIEQAGFEKKGCKGSHTVWSHPTHRTDNPLSDIITLQSVKGKAKAYQVQQVVKFIRTARPKKEVKSEC